MHDEDLETGTGKPPLSNPWVMLATWGGSGYLPKAPGTWGSLAALPFAWILYQWSGPQALLIAAALVFAIGVVAADRYMALSGEHDPGPVVVDEVAGQWLTLSMVPLDPAWFVAGFLAFRLFDVVKPWPIRWADQRVKGGFGVMFDDVLAGVYALLLLLLAQRLWTGGLP